MAFGGDDPKQESSEVWRSVETTKIQRDRQHFVEKEMLVVVVWQHQESEKTL